ncbi:MAG: hypothetical protein GY804_10015 [Alphaproteobacteria bacterium]|nr:hypothetical protein [Alphaproteobacteria bacterium]
MKPDKLDLLIRKIKERIQTLEENKSLDVNKSPRYNYQLDIKCQKEFLHDLEMLK